MSIKKAAEIAKPPVQRIILIQFLISFFLIIFWFVVVVDIETTLAASVGSLINIVSNIYFVRMAFRYQGARQADLVAKSFYRGEAGKFVCNLVLFVLVFTAWPKINEIALFVGYGLAQLSYWLGLAIGLDKKPANNSQA